MFISSKESFISVMCLQCRDVSDLGLGYFTYFCRKWGESLGKRRVRFFRVSLTVCKARYHSGITTRDLQVFWVLHKQNCQ